MLRYRLAVFDFDGTLADSLPWMIHALDGAAQRFGFRRVGPAEIAMLRGQDNRAIVRYLGVPFWKIPLIAAYIRDLAAERANETPLFPGVEEMLRRLSENGIVLAIVSSNAEATIRRVLGPRTADLISFYESRAALFGKAAKFARVLRRSRMPSTDAIAIGDEARDIHAARRTGLAAGAVCWGYAAPELLRSLHPDLVFEQVAEITQALVGGERAAAGQ
ncbi:HAD hydrolase-like protein [Arenibaculum pallidiluteum]|uniref:HAD hydrolase-like protein n=1 Tax=Arenibaculum pallidiluteum TaxID=2812559 RepID=UPI001A976DA8|nr:HAD hydrolase-like protein [Arenibaculum pallidiluteum]